MRRIIAVIVLLCLIVAVVGCDNTSLQIEQPSDPLVSFNSSTSPTPSDFAVPSDDLPKPSDFYDTYNPNNPYNASNSYNPSDPSVSSGDSSAPSSLSPTSSPANATISDSSWRIKVTNTEGTELWSFTEAELKHIPPERAGAFAHVYSSINNWPTSRFYAADGYQIENILFAAEALDIAQTIKFRAADGYEVSLTRDQLLSQQYYFPKVGEDDSGAVPVYPIIAYRWREGTDNINEIRNEKPLLIFGQRNPFEHTNPAFIEEIVEIVIDTNPSETWSIAGTFPLAGPIAEGETVKLQHPDLGRVKLHYTLDGSDPTPLSTMYNPSTYQPELNRPIPITEPTTIKVLVTGFGKNDSEIAVFEFVPMQD